MIAQLQFLNKILDSKDCDLITRNNLNDAYFSDYSKEFNFIKKHIDDYGNIPDKETFLTAFPSFDIIQVDESDDYLLTALNDDYNFRFLAGTFNKIRNLINEQKIDEAMALYTDSMSHMSNNAKTTSVDLVKDTSRFDAYVERSNDFTKFYVKTGFPELDAVIGGWDRQEELATIVARPNVGKSFVLFKVALAAAQQGLNVGIYSGEMSERKVGYRIDTLLSHISNMKLIHGDTSILNDYKKHIQTMKDKITGSLKVITPAMIHGPAGVSALRAFIENENLDILCVDQHSLLEDDKKAKSPVERAANISRDLKNLQVMKHIPIIAVSQQNRSSTEDGIDVSKIAQSDRIGQDSTIVLFLEQNNGVMTMTLTKSRDSANGIKFQYAVDIDKGIFSYIPSERDGNQDTTQCEQLRREFEEENIEGEDTF